MNEEQQPQSSGRSKAPIIVGVIVALLLVVGVVTAVAMNQETIAPASTQQTETGDTQTKPDEPSVTDQTNTEGAPTATITFTGNGFSPSNITVKKWTVVTVINESDTEVQFSSDNHPTHRENPEMNLAVLAPGEKATFSAGTVGTHGFHDHIDDSKTGTLVVTE